MFFILSKVLDFAISPLIWVIILLIISIFIKTPVRKKIALLSAIIILLVFSNTFILNKFIERWEYKTNPVVGLKTYRYGILLGGMSRFDNELKMLSFSNDIDRLMQTFKLYKSKKIKKIFIAGGSGSPSNQDFKEALYLRDYLLEAGVPEEDILFEGKSRNTHENAIFTKKALGNVKNSDCLLITSAIHMKRALACYKKAGLNPDYFVTERYSVSNKFEFELLFFPESKTLGIWEDLLHEYFGYLVYYIVGYV